LIQQNTWGEEKMSPYKEKILRRAAQIVLAMLTTLGFGHDLSASALVFNNFGPEYTYDSFHGYSVGNAGFPNTFAWAGNFSPNGTGNLDELWLPINVTPTESLTLTLSTDQSGLPGSAIWSTTITDQLGGDMILHLERLGGPQLLQGSSYWLAAAGTSTPYRAHGWCWNGIGELGNVAFSTNDGPWQLTTWQPTPGMMVGVVPEPSTIVLLGIGVACLLGYDGRKKGQNDFLGMN
jgi:hypothetical protein